MSGKISAGFESDRPAQVESRYTPDAIVAELVECADGTVVIFTVEHAAIKAPQIATGQMPGR